MILTQTLAQPVEAENRDKHCGGKRRQGEPGATCRRPAGWGTPHVGIGRCKLHSGSIPNVVKHIEAKVIEQRARELFGKRVDSGPVDNPLEVFAQLAGRVMGWMRTMDELVHDLDSPRWAAMTGEQIRGEVLLFERALDRCNTVLATYAKLGIDERLARITEAQSFMVMQAIESALAAAGVTGSRAIEAKRAAAKRLRVIEGSAAVDRA